MPPNSKLGGEDVLKANSCCTKAAAYGALFVPGVLKKHALTPVKQGIRQTQVDHIGWHQCCKSDVF